MTSPRPLATQARAHDLPASWDGWLVTWDGWQHTGNFHICGPINRAPAVCHFCGSDRRQVMNRGRAWSAPGAHVPYRRPRDYHEAAENQRAERDGSVMLHLFAFRCPDCRGDHVITKGSHVHHAATESWDLDETDYGITGSELTQGELF